MTVEVNDRIALKHIPSPALSFLLERAGRRWRWSFSFIDFKDNL